MNERLVQYFQCPSEDLPFVLKGSLSPNSGYFRFRENATCYGRLQAPHAPQPGPFRLADVFSDVESKDGAIHLPFDPTQVVDNLRCERYVSEWRRAEPVSALAKAYYLLRPMLPVKVRKRLQKIYLRGWEKLPFPRWPVDCSVDSLLQELLLLSVRSSKQKKIPFIWFWPDGASSSLIMTHDVETTVGRDFCSTLMDIDDSFGIKSSFQIVPEQRYGVSKQFLDSIRARGFEIVIHDLNHDGHLYRDARQFQQRAAKINAYAKEYGAQGFRAAILYRKQLWYDALKVSYDMSIPNVAHLDPQRGGCCTVMPYFLGEILELPVTTTQDYTLFHILHDYSITLWQEQIDLVMQKHGLISFIVHPDYVVKGPEQSVYQELLSYLVRLREERKVWIATPGKVNRWWRQRSQMRLVQNGSGWEIEGTGKERARIAWASENDDQQLVFTLQTPARCEVEKHSQLPSGVSP